MKKLQPIVCANFAELRLSETEKNGKSGENYCRVLFQKRTTNESIQPNLT